MMERIVVRYAESWSEFRSIWVDTMEHLPWFSDPGIIDYHVDAELSELKGRFEDPSHVFLITEKNGEISGALEFACFEQHAKNGVMMPGVPLAHRETRIAAGLLETQERILLERGIPVVVAVLKYRSADTASWYVEQLSRAGFEIAGPESVQMLVHLTECEFSSRMEDDLDIVGRKGFTLDDFAAFTIRAYASTSSDQQIHGHDEAVTDLTAAKRIHQMIMDGRFGPSPKALWRVALVDGTPAGYIYGFRSEREQEPDVGVIGNLGVFPEFRGKGLGILLVEDLLQSFLRAGIGYAMVGTPANNAPAITTYSRAGFEVANQIRKLRKTVNL